MIRVLFIGLTFCFSYSQTDASWFNVSFTFLNRHIIKARHDCATHSFNKGMTLLEDSECEPTKEFNFQFYDHRGINCHSPLATLMANEAYKIKTVVIDPGHGGKDPGCHGTHSQEKHIALAVAKQLREYFNERYPNIRVILTRDKDIFIPLNERAAIANRNHADLFISIHCNAISRYYGTQGSETYVLGLHRAEDNLDVAKRENAAIFYEEDYEQTYNGFDPNSNEGHIILSMYQNAFLEQSILFATQVEHHFAEVGRKSRGVKQAGFLVLRETTMPSVLIETGFLTNRVEENFLSTQSGQELMATSIFNAFQDYKKVVEDKANSAIADMQSTRIPAEFTATTQATSTPTYSVSTPSVTLPEVQGETNFYHSSKKINPDDISFSDEFGTEKLETHETIEVDLKGQTPKKEVINKPINKKSSTPKNSNINWDMPIQYRVQLAASRTKIKTTDAKWQDIPYVVEIIWEDDRNKYQIRDIRTLQEADKIRQEMMHRGFMGVFILAYHGNERISVEEAQRRKRGQATGR